MKILAADTSTPIASIALADGTSVLAEHTVELTNMHTSQLIPLIDAALHSVHWHIKDIELFAVGLGPGSFTGVRIGVSTLKSLAYALQKPIVGVCTLDILAFGLKQSAIPVCAMLDARRKEVYAAVYESPPVRTSDIFCLSIERLVQELPGSAVMVGSGADTYRDELEAIAGNRFRFAEPVFGLPRASLLSQMALFRAVQGETDDPKAVTPLYVRKPEAEVQYETGRLGSKTLI